MYLQNTSADECHSPDGSFSSSSTRSLLFQLWCSNCKGSSSNWIIPTQSVFRIWFQHSWCYCERLLQSFHQTLSRRTWYSYPCHVTRSLLHMRTMPFSDIRIYYGKLFINSQKFIIFVMSTNSMFFKQLLIEILVIHLFIHSYACSDYQPVIETIISPFVLHFFFLSLSYLCCYIRLHVLILAQIYRKANIPCYISSIICNSLVILPYFFSDFFNYHSLNFLILCWDSGYWHLCTIWYFHFVLFSATA